MFTCLIGWCQERLFYNVTTRDAIAAFARGAAGLRREWGVGGGGWGSGWGYSDMDKMGHLEMSMQLHVWEYSTFVLQLWLYLCCLIFSLGVYSGCVISALCPKTSMYR